MGRHLPDKVGLLEFKLELLRRVQVIEDHKAVGWLIVGNLAEIDALC